jgi:prevent-host-death family protein
MITNLRDAKSRFSELVRRAAAGEEILVTVRGEPTVRLSAIQSVGGNDGDRAEWVDELKAAAEMAAPGKRIATSQSYWDESRGGR